MRTYAIVAGLALSALASVTTEDYSLLVGKWAGSVERNQRDRSQGGNPSEGEVGTPVNIHWAKSTQGLEGTSRLGKWTETWTLHQDEYTWKDDRIEVRTKRVSFEKIPQWIKEELSLKATDHLWAFKFSGCKDLKTSASCKPKEHYPEGMDLTAHWIFKVEANQLRSHVVYLYPDGARRILVESLKKE